MKQIVMAITGASGAAYARCLAERLLSADVHLHLVISAAGRRVLRQELGLKRFSAAALLGRETDRATDYPPGDVGARLASGSFRSDGMVICPCSMRTLGAVAGGLADNLVTRAALVTLKEARRLVLVPREMPLSVIDLENMLRVARAGAIVCPASPAFYLRPQGVEDLVNFVVARVLDLLGVAHDLPVRWNPADGGPGDGTA